MLKKQRNLTISHLQVHHIALYLKTCLMGQSIILHQLRKKHMLYELSKVSQARIGTGPCYKMQTCLESTESTFYARICPFPSYLASGKESLSSVTPICQINQPTSPQSITHAQNSDQLFEWSFRSATHYTSTQPIAAVCSRSSLCALITWFSMSPASWACRSHTPSLFSPL